MIWIACYYANTQNELCPPQTKNNLKCFGEFVSLIRILRVKGLIAEIEFYLFNIIFFLL